ncbi:tyrosine-protein phosphatase [Brevibacterium renqingii]|uniref:tyrosine-protein phosphatase n=1 Tax=Brevibacterium renqingii TaxID=2776916 RepID=UPI001AE07A2B|nr:tyrosine-protein phosphatase [Brevibacterium renqingii]
MSLERLPIEGTFNFRDLGGARTRAGDSAVRRGIVFRADGLAQLTDSSRADIRALGIGTVIDLRDIGERAKLPDALEGLGVERIELPVFDDHFFPSRPMSAEEMKAAAEATGMDLSDRSLSRIYDLMITHFGHRLALAVDTVAEHCAEGVVFHCSAGKDRTGVVGAFLLDLLGVGREEIIDEYAITSTHLSGGFLQSITRNFADAGISGNLAETATASPPELMHGILERLEAEHGAASAGEDGADSAVEDYLRKHGMDPATPERLRARLLGPAD